MSKPKSKVRQPPVSPWPVRHKVAYQNRQLYCECQLVSIWNAARFWGFGKLVPRMGSPDYKRTCHKARAIHGGAIVVDFEAERLGLSFYPLAWDVEDVALHMPCEMSVFCERGYRPRGWSIT